MIKRAKTKLMFDARSITTKPCGVRRVAEHYLREVYKHYDIIIVANRNMSDAFQQYTDATICFTNHSRFSFLSDFWITYLVIKHKPTVFFSAHSFLPIFAFLPKRRIFICHDLFAALDRNFFSKYGVLAFLPRVLFRLMSEISFIRSSVVVAPSEKIKSSYSSLYAKAKKVVVVHNGVKVNQLRRNLSQREKKILFVGNFRNYKGFGVLVKAWNALSQTKDIASWELIVVTNETEASVDEFVRKNGVLHRVSFFSRVDDENLQKLRNNSTICVIPSNYEGFGIPLIESVVSGSYTVHSDIGVFMEILEKFDKSMMRSFVAGDVDSLSCAILSVIKEVGNSNLSLDFKEKVDFNNSIAEKYFSWKASAGMIRGVINGK